MNECHAAALSRLIVEHIRLARSRCETLGWLIASIPTAGTVNLTRLAAYIDSRAQIASVHRRLERFFRDVWLNQADIARLVVAALSLTAQPWHLREFVIRLTRLSGFAAFAGSRSLFINKLDGKVFTTEADPVSVGAVIPIAPLHRYASLICFLQEAYQDTKDHIFDMYRKRCSATLDFWR